MIIQQFHIFYEINKTDLTASIINSPNVRGDVCFPSLIEHESQKFKIIGIKEGSFKNNQKIKSIIISDESAFQSIMKNAFSKSSIKKLNITSRVSNLEEGWCSKTPKLKKVTISPSNPYFKYLDEDQQIIVGKSDTNNEIFDTIIFANRDIKHATIPNHIKYIKPFAFENCKKMKTIEFSEDSKLVSIGSNAFSHSSINNLFIPANLEKLEDGWINNTPNLKTVTISPSNKHFKYLNEEHQIIIGKSDTTKDIFDTLIFANQDIKHATIPSYIKYIKSFAFENCKKMKTIEFSEDSKLISIGSNAFSHSSINNLFIPANLEKLEDGWINNTPNLKTVTISPSNKHFKYLNEEHQIIIGKSDTNNEIFDTLIFANRDIKHATIPSHIKIIQSASFSHCQQLNTIEFSEDSQLSIIGKRAFYKSGLKAITIPKSVTNIQSNAFSSCNVLHSFSIKEGSRLESLEKHLLSSCKNLSKIEIPDNSSIKNIGYELFSYSLIEEFYIPSCVEEIDDEWLRNVSHLKTVTISSLNKHFKYLNQKKNIIVGKSIPKEDIFDTILFANRDINHVTIPKIIKYIKPHAFENCKNIRSFQNFEYESRLVFFDKNIFSKSKIEYLFIPTSIEELEDGWCYHTKHLKEVIIQPKNKNFKYLDNERQIIVGKSDSQKDEFDTILFANRDIKNAVIPNNIKYIKPYAFEYCKQLKTIFFEKDSQLSIIGKRAFSFSGLKSIKIPKSVIKIRSKAFDFCYDLKNVFFENESKLISIKEETFLFDKELKLIEIPENSSLQSIGSRAFYDSSINSLFIPATVEELADDCFENANKLTNLKISPSNKNFKYMNDDKKVIVGKSDPKGDVFDTIIFADRYIKRVTIPSHIKYIKDGSFKNCQQLETINISEDSQIVAFPYNFISCSSVENLFIPKSVEELKSGWSIDTHNLTNVTISPSSKNFKFLDDDNKIIVEKSDPKKDVFDTIIFANRDIQKAIIPRHIKYIENYSFENCTKLKTIEFSLF